MLVTGGAGFIGSHFIRYILQCWSGEYGELVVVNLDKLTYGANLESLSSVRDDPRYSLVVGDICDPQTVWDVFLKHEIDTVVHFAAESHVDRSIVDPLAFVSTNALGTQVLLDAARKYQVHRFVHISTDEVYGSLGPKGKFTEASPLRPNNPYSASKAAADYFVYAAFKTHALPVIVTRCSNNYGPNQDPEKLIPMVISRAMEEKPIPIYGDGLNVRDWIYVEDHVRAIEAALFRGVPGEVYNFGGNAEKTNLEVVDAILRFLGKPSSLVRFVDDRPGHDFRYAMSSAKAEKELGWKPLWDFETGIQATIEWHLASASTLTEQLEA